MGKNRKRPRAIVKNYSGPAIKSRRLARKLTTEFHRIQQELTNLQELEESEGNDATTTKPSETHRQKRIKELQQQLDEMGGREMYQEASAISTEHFRSSRFVFQQLTKQGLRPRKKQPKLKVLEIGAVNTQLISCPWMDVRAIDLRSRDPKIEEVDFFDIPVHARPTEQEALMYRKTACSKCQAKGCHCRASSKGGDVTRTSLRYGGEYDVLVNSMVINSVFEPSSRGNMLTKCYSLLRPGGRLFLMLPRRCIEQSTFYSTHKFVECLSNVGFRFVFWRNTPKIAMLCLTRPSACECSCHAKDPWFAADEFDSESVHASLISKIASSQNELDLSVPRWPWELAVAEERDTENQDGDLSAGNGGTNFAITLDNTNS